jgi:hypothetical protein
MQHRNLLCRCMAAADLPAAFARSRPTRCPLAGGLKSELRSGEKAGGVVMGGQGEFGLLPGKRFPTGSILRSQVAECCVESLVEPAASCKLVELVTDPKTPNRTYAELFAGVAR